MSNVNLNLETLQKGDRIWSIKNGELYYYDYLMPHPKNPLYHLLIDPCAEPIRIWHETLRQYWPSKEAALIDCIEYHEEKLSSLKARLQKLKMDADSNQVK